MLSSTETWVTLITVFNTCIMHLIIYNLTVGVNFRTRRTQSYYYIQQLMTSQWNINISTGASGRLACSRRDLIATGCCWLCKCMCFSHISAEGSL
jgi:hypothetical protein